MSNFSEINLIHEEQGRPGGRVYGQTVTEVQALVDERVRDMSGGEGKLSVPPRLWRLAGLTCVGRLPLRGIAVPARNLLPPPAQHLMDYLRVNPDCGPADRSVTGLLSLMNEDIRQWIGKARKHPQPIVFDLVAALVSISRGDSQGFTEMTRILLNGAAFQARKGQPPEDGLDGPVHRMVDHWLRRAADWIIGTMSCVTGGDYAEIIEFHKEHGYGPMVWPASVRLIGQACSELAPDGQPLILADALEEAGYPTLAEHLRQPWAAHEPGCWVLDHIALPDALARVARNFASINV